MCILTVHTVLHEALPINELGANLIASGDMQDCLEGSCIPGQRRPRGLALAEDLAVCIPDISDTECLKLVAYQVSNMQFTAKFAAVHVLASDCF